MDALEAQFANRGSLRDALLPTFTDGGLFVAGSHDVTVGTAVQVRVACVGLAAALFVEGLVQWRRAAASPQGAAGLAVRLLASARDRFAFLHQWSAGDGNDSGRQDTREPLDHAAIVTTGSAGRRTGRVLHGRLRDVSRRGALVGTPARVTPGTVVQLEFQWDGAAAAFPSRVVWGHDDRAGLRVLLERIEEQARWAAVVDAARAAFRGRVALPPRTPTSMLPPA